LTTGAAIWRFTVYWGLTLNIAVFGLSALYAVLIFGRRRKRHLPFVIGIPALIITFQALIAFIASTVIGASSAREIGCVLTPVAGFALAAIYVAAYLRMSTWIPFLWAFAHSMYRSRRACHPLTPRKALVVVVSSYTTVTVLL
jgi:hypothetical protein